MSLLRRSLTAAVVAGAAMTAAAATAGAVAWWQLLRRPLPRTEGRLELEGVEGQVVIRRDRWGVPHVRATNERDLWFGQGFCHGQDRLWQLDLYRRVAAGRLAEVAGPAALPADRLMRTLGIRRVAERELDDLEPRVLAAVEALCSGINAAARDADARPFELQVLRREFVPYTPVDVLSAQKLISLGLGTNWEHEMLRADMARELGPELAARLDPTYPVGAPVVLRPGLPGSGPPLELMAERVDQIRRYLGMTVEATGSNNWAVSGSRTASGRPLIAGDPHLAPGMPGVMYQMGLELDDRFLCGASLPGTPGIALGQGTDVAWSLTNVMADVMDLFAERIEGENYLFEGEWRRLEIHEEVIEVKGREPNVLVVRATHHGPIVNEALRADEAEPLALSWSALRFPAVTTANLAPIGARSGTELVELMADHASPVSNLVWADRGGSIGYKAIGKVPVREGGSPDLPRCGWSGEDEWVGWVPFDELPRLDDPDCGYVITANNRIAADDYPHHLTSEYLDGARARRIEVLIERTDEHDVDSFARMQLDMISAHGLETARRLARLEPRGQAEVSAIERLRSWDGRMSPNSVAASLYQAFTLRLGREVARRAIGDRDLAERWLGRADNGFMSHVLGTWRWQSHLLELWAEADPELIHGSWEDLALDSLRGAIDDLADRFGPDPRAWRWGAVHRVEFPHAMGLVHPLLARLLDRSAEVGGGQETVAQVGWEPSRPFTATWAPAWRIVADPADASLSRWQQFTGNSGHPGSPHYDDLLGRWRDGLTQPIEGEGPWRELRLEPAAGGPGPSRPADLA